MLSAPKKFTAVVLSLAVTFSFASALHFPKSTDAASAVNRDITPLMDLFEYSRMLPSSLRKKTTKVPYALPINIMLRTPDGAPLTQDMNGDGLIDIVYASNWSSTSATQYVLLNTGSGYTIAYLCAVNTDTTSQNNPITTYKGDCADTN